MQAGFILVVIQVILLILSFFLLYYGAEITLSSSRRLGFLLGLPHLLVGILIMGFGTSLPEFFVSHLAVYRGENPLALGNIIGSNIANLFLILGLSCCLKILVFKNIEIKRQFFFHLLATICFVLILLTLKFPWWSSVPLLFLFAFYLYDSYSRAQQGYIKPELLDVSELRVDNSWKNISLLIIKFVMGIILLSIGSNLIVTSSTFIAIALGVSSYVIASTIIAFGTSLPELVVSLLILKRGMDTDLIVGNVIGSNIFNILFVFSSLSFYNILFEQRYLAESLMIFFSALILLVLAVFMKKVYRVVGFVHLFFYLLILIKWTRS